MLKLSVITLSMYNFMFGNANYVLKIVSCDGLQSVGIFLDAKLLPNF